MIFPEDFKRQYASSLDPDVVFATKELLDAYITAPNRYPGQIVSCLAAECENFIYRMNNAATAWIPIAVSPTSPTVVVNLNAETTKAITHGLNKQPLVRIYDADNEEIIGQITLNAADMLNTLTVDFNIPLTGYIIIS